MADRGRGRGRGQRGGRGGGRGRGALSTGDTTNGRICYEFQRTGACKRTSCTFAHVESRSEDRNAAPAKAIETKEQKEARKFYNKWRGFLISDASDPSVAKRVWKFGLEILEDGDRECQQKVARDLDSEEKTYENKGRLHITAIMSQRAQGGDYERLIKNSERFLRIVTHPFFLDCLAVQSNVVSIYRFISGISGERAVPFFQRLCEILVAVRTDEASSTTPTERLESALCAMSLALREVLKQDKRARFNDQLENLLEALDTAAKIFAPDTPTICSTQVINHVRCMRDMVVRSNNLLAKTSINDDATSTPSSSYPRNLVIPSNRHDNDKLDVREIAIFPTQDEIMSDAPEFLPFTDPDQPHILEDPAQRHIDTHFRLYRHDVIGELKATLAGLMQVLIQDKMAIANGRLQTGDMRAYQYTAAHIRDVQFDRALEIQMAFLPPHAIRQQNLTAQMRWWEESNRLAQGSLLSFIWIEGDKVQHIFLKLQRKKIKGRDQDIVTYDDGGIATITAYLMAEDRATLETLMRAYASKAQGVLLEFPRIMPGTFVPILENLQDMQSLGGMPFQQYIVPPPHDGPRSARICHDIQPPLYARHADFAFPLKAIAKSSNDTLSISPMSSSEDNELLDQIELRTSLDRGQCQALIAALIREFAFIQGPPGTGKSYLGVHLMRILLDIKEKAKLGPILVVCYTNHALDQFLEHLIEVGINKIIRVGGQSKQPALADHNLHSLRRMEPNTKSENYLAAQAFKAMSDHKSIANRVLDDLRHAQRQVSWHGLEDHICEEYPDIAFQFSDVDEEGFRMVGRHPFDIWCMTVANGPNIARQTQKPPPIDDVIRKATTNVYALNYHERHVLIDHWVRQTHEAKVNELSMIVEDAASTQKQLDNIHAESSRRVLQDADVIGLTTTGLAGRMSILKHVASKVLICEEAGEILEPHMLSALLPTIEHCIQIGDHEQLRPSVSNFKDLSMESERGKLHQLDKSQFERLSVGEAGRPSVPVAQLNVQRRMRPEISALIRKTIYDKLIDHESTAHMPDVVGLRKNMFWLDHDHHEDGQQMEIQHSKSKSNSWEVSMVHAMVRHIVRQGVYKRSDIAVLTPYTGQLQKLRTALSSDFEIVISDRDEEALDKDGFKVDNEPLKDEIEHGKKKLEKKALTNLLRIATIDNFQGEEAKVIIISLVRSNKQRNVGFLRTTNRINVLLSRAKHGMYLIGNADTYSTVAMWQEIIDSLRAIDLVGPAIDLCCPRHPHKIMEVHKPEDFARFSPEGGCMEMCDDRLDCGHSCRAPCHSEAMHAAFSCEEPCQRRHAICDHPCQKSTCGESCGPCTLNINNVRLPCSHTANGVPCHLTQDLSRVTCKIPVTKKVPRCGHEVIVRCFEDVSTEHFKCSITCMAPLSCGHTCTGTCSQCTSNGQMIDDKPTVKHIACTEKCGRKMGTCLHACDRDCHSGSGCGLCLKPCAVRCKHNKCRKNCYEPCAPCIQPCQWSCPHQGGCSLPCSAPCDRLPCDERCSKLLSCGHQCPSICSEECPIDCCQECGMGADAEPDMIEFKTYSEIDLDETPIIALPCKHFFTVETLDGHVGLDTVYKKDSMSGQYVGLLEDVELSANIPQCPHCRAPIRQYATQRYNRLINKAVIDEMTKRFIVSGQTDLQQLEADFEQLSEAMEDSRQIVIPNITIPSANPQASMRKLDRVKYLLGEALAERYADAMKLERNVEAFQKRMSQNNQPANKLYQATMYVYQKAGTLDSDFAKLNLQRSAPLAQQNADQRIEKGGRLLQNKIRCLVLEDKLEISRLSKIKFSIDVLKPDAVGGDLISQANAYLNICVDTIEECRNSNLPKLAVETILYHSRIARALGPSSTANDEDRKSIEGRRQAAKDLLEEAAKLCELSFKGAEALAEAVDKSLKLLGKDFYAEVTKDEIEAIKKAMVSGPGGIATHSGHWYKCINGHPFAIGECGMAMERARCPECGEAVGGENHTAVAGVTRAQNMEI